jgi:hypothetical protein
LQVSLLSPTFSSLPFLFLSHAQPLWNYTVMNNNQNQVPVPCLWFFISKFCYLIFLWSLSSLTPTSQVFFKKNCSSGLWLEKDCLPCFSFSNTTSKEKKMCQKRWTRWSVVLTMIQYPSWTGWLRCQVLLQLKSIIASSVP